MRQSRKAVRDDHSSAVAIECPGGATPREIRLVWSWIACISLLIVQRPLDAPDLWWHLARGREVIGGTVAPSRHLLVLDTSSEADWLGGVPFYALWRAGGLYALAAVPWASALGLAALLVRRSVYDSRLLMPLLQLPLVLWIIRRDLQPVPEVFDLFGMAALWLMLQADIPPARRTMAVAVLLLLWSNLGPRPIWSLLVLGLYSPPGVLNVRLLFTAVFAGMLNPRGVFAWQDALLQFAPAAFVGLGDSAEPTWYGVVQGPPWDSAVAALALVWLLCVVCRQRERATVMQIARWAVPLLAAVVCRANLAACGVWLLLEAVHSSRGQDSRCVSSGTTAGSASPAGHANPSRGFGRRAACALLAAMVLVFALVDAAGGGSAPRARLGWGISHAIDPRLLDVEPLVGAEGPRIGWSPDSRCTGIVTWLGAARMCDHPRRALLGGRWPLHSDLIADFLSDHRAAYRRDDGTSGGWLKQLVEWEVKLLFVPMEDLPMHRSLIATSWQPADLDSPTVPYVSGEDVSHARVIVDSLRQQGLVEIGPWQPSSEIYNRAGWCYDVPELLGYAPPPYAAIRQAQFFRGLEMPMAALRALLPIRQAASERQLLDEFAACQSAMFWHEREVFGRASRFRLLVVSELSDFVDTARSHEASDIPAQSRSDDAAWRNAVDHYIGGRIAEAIGALPRTDGQADYAAAMLRLELGETEQARSLLQQVHVAGSDPSLSIAAEHWLGRIASLDAPDEAGRPKLHQEPL